MKGQEIESGPNKPFIGEIVGALLSLPPAGKLFFTLMFSVPTLITVGSLITSGDIGMTLIVGSLCYFGFLIIFAVVADRYHWFEK